MRNLTQKKRYDVKVGDQVLVKRHERGGKLDSKYLNKKYTVKERRQSLVIVVDEEANELARNIQKEIQVNDNEITKADRKSYPKRNYRPVNIYHSLLIFLGIVPF